MVLTPELIIERIKQEIKVLEYAERELGVSFSGNGSNLIGKCPLPGHEDKTPSFVVTPSNNLWHCMGKCNKGGSIIDLVIESGRAREFREAIEILKDYLPHYQSVEKETSINNRANNRVKLSLDADEQTLINKVIEHYHSEVAEAMPYLASRGLVDEEMIKKFGIGFCNRTLGQQLPERYLKAAREAREKLHKIGITREDGQEVFRGCVTIPIYDEEGNVVEVYARKVTSWVKKGTPVHLYLKGEHRGIWNREGIKGHKTIILCESLIDALTLYQAGFHNVTSSYGVNGFTAEHKRYFIESGVERIINGYDRDNAGEKRAKELAVEMSEEGIESYRIELPWGMDINEYAMKEKPSRERWEDLINHAKLISKVSKLTPAIEVTESIKAALIEGNNVIEEPVNEESISKESINEAPIKLAEIKLDRRGEDLFTVIGDREYRVRGTGKNLSIGQMKVNVRLKYKNEIHQDTIDICLHRGKKEFAAHAEVEIGVKAEIVRKDLSKILGKLEEIQDEEIKKVLEPKKIEISMTEEQIKKATTFLKDKNLVKNIRRHFRECGIVGEDVNMMMGYVGAVSRKLDKPLAIIIQSPSAAGKTTIMEKILSMMPKEEQIKYSAMTGQSLFYLGDMDVEHKIIAFSEEEGVQKASYAIKILQSEGELTIASTGKDPLTGRMIAHQYQVKGPVMIFTTTTAIDIDEELLNRCIILVINDSREQTRAIHEMQREQYTEEGLLGKKKKNDILELHQNAQRLLKPISVLNPYSKKLKFMDEKMRTRRDNIKYLGIISAITLLHQYQREIRRISNGEYSEECVVVELEDIELANELANEVLGRSLDDMPAQTRKFLMMIDDMANKRCKELMIKREDYRVTQREMREYSGFGNTQTKIHLQRLIELEYVIVHRGGRGQQFVYEIIYDGEGKDGSLFLPGLIKVEQLRAERAAQQNNNAQQNNAQNSNVQTPTDNEKWSEKRNKESVLNRGRIGAESV